MTVIYYEYEPVLGVNSTYDDSYGVRHYDYFASIRLFNNWVAFEMNHSKTVEITDKNYQSLAEKGVI